MEQSMKTTLILLIIIAITGCMTVTHTSDGQPTSNTYGYISASGNIGQGLRYVVLKINGEATNVFAPVIPGYKLPPGEHRLLYQYGPQTRPGGVTTEVILTVEPGMCYLPWIVTSREEVDGDYVICSNITKECHRPKKIRTTNQLGFKVFDTQVLTRALSELCPDDLLPDNQ